MTAVLLASAASAVSAVLALLLFPSGHTLRLDVSVGGESAEVAWSAFLDKLFTHFDRDGDGSLSPAEAARLFPLPLPDGRGAKPAFPKPVTRGEFRAAYRAAGFTPVVVVVRPAPPESLRLGAALFHHLDRDGNGSLSAEEVKRIPALLRRLDEDEDEVLTAAELLATAPERAIPAAGLKFATGEEPASQVLYVGPDGKPTLGGKGETFQLSADGDRLIVPGGTCVLTAPTADPTAGLRSAKGFYLAQFDAVAGDKPAAKAAFADDPAAQVLADLFEAADRDGNGKLTRVELEAFFDLISAGVSCRAVVTATDRGRNLFDLIDGDGDGRLDFSELIRAASGLSATLAGKSADKLPASYRLSVMRGTVGDSFGHVPFGTPAKPTAVAKAKPVVGPRWFRAMDRNDDGFVSASEFSGPPELFRKFDKDGDGRISAAEAAAKP